MIFLADQSSEVSYQQLLEDLTNAVIHSQSTLTLFTSGTTGQPKKIKHALQNLLRNIKINENQDVFG